MLTLNLFVCLFITWTKARLCIASNSSFSGSYLPRLWSRGAKLESINTVPVPDLPRQPPYITLPLYPAGQPTDLQRQLYGSLRMLFMPRSLCVGYTATDSLVYFSYFHTHKAKQQQLFRPSLTGP